METKGVLSTIISAVRVGVENKSTPLPSTHLTAHEFNMLKSNLLKLSANPEPLD